MHSQDTFTIALVGLHIIETILCKVSCPAAAWFTCGKGLVITQLHAQKCCSKLGPFCDCVVSSDLSRFGQSLSSEVILENGRLPEGVSITYKSICKNGVEGTGENGRKCSNISIGDEVCQRM